MKFFADEVSSYDSVPHVGSEGDHADTTNEIGANLPSGTALADPNIDLIFATFMDDPYIDRTNFIDANWPSDTGMTGMVRPGPYTDMTKKIVGSEGDPADTTNFIGANWPSDTGMAGMMGMQQPGMQQPGPYTDMTKKIVGSEEDPADTTDFIGANWPSDTNFSNYCGKSRVNSYNYYGGTNRFSSIGMTGVDVTNWPSGIGMGMQQPGMMQPGMEKSSWSFGEMTGRR